MTTRRWELAPDGRHWISSDGIELPVITGGEDPPDDDNGDEGGEGEGDDDEDQSGSSSIDDETLKKVVEAAVTKATEAANSTADKRINQILDRIEGRGGKADPPKGEETPDQVLAERFQKTQRKLLKVAIRDEVRRLDADVQPIALKLAQKAADRMTITEDTDEDQVATDLISEIEEQLKEARETFGKAVRDDLKSRGLLKDDDGEDDGEGKKGSDGQPPKASKEGDEKTDPMKLMEEGKAVAEARFGTGQKKE